MLRAKKCVASAGRLLNMNRSKILDQLTCFHGMNVYKLSECVPTTGMGWISCSRSCYHTCLLFNNSSSEESEEVGSKSISNDKKLTPMMNQYFKIKEKHADYLLLFRMGDFYEMFFDDAVRASEVLHITVG